MRTDYVGMAKVSLHDRGARLSAACAAACRRTRNLKASHAHPRCRTAAGFLPCRIPGQQWPHEGPFVAEHAAAVVPDAVRFDEVRVGAEQGAVLLIEGYRKLNSKK